MTALFFGVGCGGGCSSSLVVESESDFRVVYFWHITAFPRVTLVEGVVLARQLSFLVLVALVAAPLYWFEN